MNSLNPKNIIYAIQSGRTQEVIRLIEQDDMTDENDLGTYLVLSSLYGHLDLAQTLVKKGADVNHQEGKALYYAVTQSHLLMIDFLINNNITANVNESFQYACSLFRFDIIDCFLSKGYQLTDDNDKPFISFLESMSRMGSHVSFSRYLDYMLKRGANIHADGNFLLNIAIEQNNLPLVQSLVEQNLSVNYVKSFSNSKYHTLSPLSLACSLEKEDIVHYLLNQNHQVIKINENNGDALLQAIKKKSLSLIKLLCEHGANVNLGNNQALFLTLQRPHSQQIEIIQCLLRYGADINAHDSLCLMTFLKSHEVNLEIVHLWLSYGANLPKQFYTTNDVSQYVKDLVLDMITQRDLKEHLKNSLSNSQTFSQPKI